jgi:hypothetical protein
VTASLTGIAAWLIYYRGWEAHIPITTTWNLVDLSKIDTIEPATLVFQTYLDSYNTFYHYPGYYFFTFFWTFSRFIPFYYGLFFVVTSIVASAVINVFIIRIVAQHFVAQRPGKGAIGRSSFMRVVKYILVNTAYWLILVALVNTGVGIPLAIYIGIRWMLVGHIILFEGTGILDAIKRSPDLLSDNWLRAFSYMIIFTFLVFSLIAGMSLIPYWGSTAARVLAIPIPTIFITLFYIILRQEKEAYSPSQIVVDLAAWTAGVKPVYPGKAEEAAEREEKWSKWDEFWSSRKRKQKTKEN